MPRKAAAAYSVITPMVDHRPPVPDGMPEAQAIIWERIVGRMPNGWFRKEHVDLLEAYCVRAAMAHQLARKIADFKPEWLDVPGGTEQLELLTRLLDREHRAVVMLARSMRLTHQAQYQPQRVSPGAGRQQPEGRRPWEPDAKAARR